MADEIWAGLAAAFRNLGQSMNYQFLDTIDAKRTKRREAALDARLDKQLLAQRDRQNERLAQDADQHRSLMHWRGGQLELQREANEARARYQDRQAAAAEMSARAALARASQVPPAKIKSQLVEQDLPGGGKTRSIVLWDNAGNQRVVPLMQGSEPFLTEPKPTRFLGDTDIPLTEQQAISLIGGQMRAETQAMREPSTADVTSRLISTTPEDPYRIAAEERIWTIQGELLKEVEKKPEGWFAGKHPIKEAPDEKKPGGKDNPIEWTLGINPYDPQYQARVPGGVWNKYYIVPGGDVIFFPNPYSKWVEDKFPDGLYTGSGTP